MATNSAWIWKIVKQSIPPLHIIYSGLHDLFLTFGSLKCIKFGLPLFGKVAWKSSVNVLLAVKDRHVCVRSTYSLEGGVHQNMVRKFGSFGAGPELTDCALTEYRLRHNTDHIEKLRINLHILTTQHTGVSVSNELDFCNSDEVFGIYPIYNDVMETLRVEKSDTLVSSSSSVSKSDILYLSDAALLLLAFTKRERNSRSEYIARKQATYQVRYTSSAYV
ncbi:hypothetical protein INT47_010322 [Mucor saturninus]|uniref:Uncharacterized protein n=1 Tax=Mucor saturninus TaxID=64648 RepID=A0A8H7QIW3_9FUNG|nr:hypothetical protein INT47_010322 [Mucor saturninus]